MGECTRSSCASFSTCISGNILHTYNTQLLYRSKTRKRTSVQSRGYADFTSFMCTEVCVCVWAVRVCVCVCVCAQLCPTLCNPMDCSLPGSSVHGISQARILEWVAISSSRGSSWPRDRAHVPYASCLASGFFTASTTWEALFLAWCLSCLLDCSFRRARTISDLCCVGSVLSAPCTVPGRE